MSKTRRPISSYFAAALGAFCVLATLLACSSPSLQERFVREFRSAEVCVENNSRDAVEVRLYKGPALIETFRDVSMVRPKCLKIPRSKLNDAMYASVSPYGNPRSWQPETLQRMRFDDANKVTITIGHKGLTRYAHSTYTVW